MIFIDYRVCVISFVCSVTSIAGPRAGIAGDVEFNGEVERPARLLCCFKVASFSGFSV